MLDIVEKIVHCIANNQNAVLVSIAAESGSTPRGAGAKMLVMEGGKSLGTIGGGAVEYSAQKLAATVLQSGQSQLKEYDLSPDAAASLGMVCGGKNTVFVQFIPAASRATQTLWGEVATLLRARKPFVLLTAIPSGHVQILQPGSTAPLAYSTLPQHKSLLCEAAGQTYLADPFATGGRALIFGMGHVGAQLVPVLHRLHFYTLAMDDRAEFITPENAPLANKRLLVDFPTAVASLSVTKEDYIVILTRGHQHDYNVLRGALATPARYIGMIGSRNKVQLSLTRLAQDGFSPANIARLHAPIGLPLGGESPEEIAISIAAEMIQARAGLFEKNEPQAEG